jgi:hypothetical protein
MSLNSPTRLELGSLRLLLSSPNCTDEALRAQINQLTIASRELTGAGMVTRFSVPDKSASVFTNKQRFSNLSGQAPSLRLGFGGVLYVEAGKLDSLEFFTYDEPWPAKLDAFSLSLEQFD